MPVLVLAGAMMQMPQRALKILNLALVINFLPLSQFQRLQHFLHLIKGMLQFINDSVHLVDRIRDRRSPMLGFAWARPFGLLAFMTLVPFMTLPVLVPFFAALLLPFALVPFFPIFAFMPLRRFRFKILAIFALFHLLRGSG